ncbi:MAG: metallophosphoesterase [Bacilli bacterium]
MSNADFILLNGDMVNTFQNEELIFNGFMRAVSDAAHGNIPIFYARGNHECQKVFRSFLDYFPTKTGKPYYAFMRAYDVFSGSRYGRR